MSVIRTDFIDELLQDSAPVSWHEGERRDLGIPDECAGDLLLCLSLERPADDLKATPMAFVVDPFHLADTLAALASFLREAFHPVTGRSDMLAVLDFLPPIDDFGAAQGISRRWVLDRFNYGLVLPDVGSFLRTIASAL